MHRRPNEDAGAQARSLDYEEDHRHELEDAAGEHPQVENTVQIAHVFGDIERHARGVAHAADGEQGKCHGVEQRHELGQLKDDMEIMALVCRQFTELQRSIMEQLQLMILYQKDFW